MLQQLDALLREVVREQKGLSEVVFTIRQFNELVERINSLSKECWEREKDARSLAAELTMKDAALDGFEEENKQLANAIQTFRTLVSENLQEIRYSLDQEVTKQQRWKSSLERERETCQFLEDTLKAIGEEKMQAKAEVTHLNTLRERLQSEKLLATDNFIRVQNLADNLTRRGEEARRELEALRHSEAKLKQLVETDLAQISQRRQEISQLHAMAKEKDTKIEELVKQRESDKAHILQMKKEIKDVQSKMSHKEADIETEQQNNKRGESMLRDIDKLTREKAELKLSNDDLTVKIDTLNNKLVILGTELSQCKSEKDFLKGLANISKETNDSPVGSSEADHILKNGTDSKESQAYLKKLFQVRKNCFKTTKTYLQLLNLEEKEHKQVEKEEANKVKISKADQSTKNNKMDAEDRKRSTSIGSGKQNNKVIITAPVEIIAVNKKGQESRTARSTSKNIKGGKGKAKKKPNSKKGAKKMDEERISKEMSREEEEKSKESFRSQRSLPPLNKPNNISPQQQARTKLLTHTSNFKVDKRCKHDGLVFGCDDCEAHENMDKMLQEKRAESIRGKR